MKKWITLTLATLLVTITFAQSGYIEDFKIKWKNAAAYTLEIAELMPEEHYDFKPTEEEMSFQQQLLHIMSNANWLSSDFLGGEKLTQDLRTAEYSKAEVIAILREGFANVAAALENLQPEQLEESVKFFAGPMNKRQIMTLLNDHHTHHRGQLIVYLRLNGVKPPRYVGW